MKEPATHDWDFEAWVKSELVKQSARQKQAEKVLRLRTDPHFLKHCLEEGIIDDNVIIHALIWSVHDENEIVIGCLETLIANCPDADRFKREDKR